MACADVIMCHPEMKELRADARFRSLKIKRKQFEVLQTRKSFSNVLESHRIHRANPNRSARGKVRTAISRGILEFGADVPRISFDKWGTRRPCAESFISSLVLPDDTFWNLPVEIPAKMTLPDRSTILASLDTSCLLNVSTQLEMQIMCSSIEENQKEMDSTLMPTRWDAAVQDAFNDDVSDWQLLNEHCTMMCDEEDWVL